MIKLSMNGESNGPRTDRWKPALSKFTRLVSLAVLLVSVNAPFATQAIADDDEFEGPQTHIQTSTPSSKPDWEDAGDPNQKIPADKAPKSTRLIEGSVNYVVPKGTPFKLKIGAVPTHGKDMKLWDRDLDGKLYPAKLNDEITARTSEDMYVDDNKVIPEGTIFHGHVSSIAPPRRVNRPGWLKITFDSITTPNGNKFALGAEADNFHKSTVKSKLKGLGGIASFTAGGAIVGTLVAYQISGLHQTIALHGYNLAAGAAAGGLAATCYAVMRHGAQARLEPGDDLNMNIDSDLLLPATTDPTVIKAQMNRKGVDVKILKSKVKKDGLEGNILRLVVDVQNSTNEDLSSIDLFCEDTNGNRLPLVGGADVDESSSFSFTVDANSKKHLILNFLVEYPHLKHKLVWLDHSTRQVCWRGPIP